MIDTIWNFLREPWVTWPETYGNIVLMGFLVNFSCGWIGLFMILRRLSLLGDALSHSLLPGVVLVFLVGAGASTLMLFSGALAAGFAALGAIWALRRFFPIGQDAAMGTVFSIWFAIGILLLSAYGGRIDLDLDCVLFGEIGAIGFLPPLEGIGLGVLPFEVVRMGIVTLVLVLFISLFYKELVISAFDPELAGLAELRPQWIQAILLGLLTLILVSGLESVGVILPVGMLVFPGATSLLLFKRIPFILISITLISVISSLGGFYLALGMDTAIAPCMLLVSAVLFGLVWTGRQFCKKTFRPIPVNS